MGCSRCCRIRSCCCLSVRVCSHIVGWLCVINGGIGLTFVARFLVKTKTLSGIMMFSPGVIFFFFLLAAGFCTLLGIWAESVTVLDGAYCIFWILILISIFAGIGLGIAFMHIQITSACLVPLVGLGGYNCIISIFMIVVNSYKFEKQDEEEAEYYDDFY